MSLPCDAQKQGAPRIRNRTDQRSRENSTMPMEDVESESWILTSLLPRKATEMNAATPPIIFCEEFEYSSENRQRRPDWRSMRATLSRPLRSDRWVKRVRRFRDSDEDERIDKDLFEAHNIHRGHRWRRAELQARILAGQLPAAIAAVMGVTLSELLAYEQIFFDVRSRQSNSFFVRHYVIDLPPLGVYGWNDVERFWHHAAHCKGPKAVDVLVSGVTHEGLDRYGLDAYLSQEYPVPEDVRFAVMAARIPLGRSERDLRTYLQIVDRMSDGRFETSALQAEPANCRPNCSADPLPSWEQYLASAREMIPDFQLAS